MKLNLFMLHPLKHPSKLPKTLKFQEKIKKNAFSSNFEA